MSIARHLRAAHKDATHRESARGSPSPTLCSFESSVDGPHLYGLLARIMSVAAVTFTICPRPSFPFRTRESFRSALSGAPIFLFFYLFTPRERSNGNAKTKLSCRETTALSTLLAEGCLVSGEARRISGKPISHVPK